MLLSLHSKASLLFNSRLLYTFEFICFFILQSAQFSLEIFIDLDEFKFVDCLLFLPLGYFLFQLLDLDVL